MSSVWFLFIIVVGTRYVEDDFDVTFGDALSREASGVSGTQNKVPFLELRICLFYVV